MHEYRVVQRSLDDNRIALVCNMGRYHLTRTLRALPLVGAMLSGAKPHMGFGLLLCLGSGDIFPVVFELINCGDLEFSQDGIRKSPRPTLRVSRDASGASRVLRTPGGRPVRPLPS
jgi:hypothetical protein